MGFLSRALYTVRCAIAQILLTKGVRANVPEQNKQRNEAADRSAASGARTTHSRRRDALRPQRAQAAGNTDAGAVRRSGRRAPGRVRRKPRDARKKADACPTSCRGFHQSVHRDSVLSRHCVGRHRHDLPRPVAVRQFSGGLRFSHRRHHRHNGDDLRHSPLRAGVAQRKRRSRSTRWSSGTSCTCPRAT